MNPQTHDERPLVTNPNQETNQLQMVIAPLGGRPLPHGAQISTTMLPLSTNPMFGLPNYVPVQGTGPSGHALQIHEPYHPQYIIGLGPDQGRDYYDYPDLYTDDSFSELEDRDEAPRRRRASKEPGTHTQRIHDGPPMTAAERIKVYEAEIQRLKEDMEREQQRQNRPLQGQERFPLLTLRGHQEGEGGLRSLGQRL